MADAVESALAQFDLDSWVRITAEGGVRASLDGISPPVLLEEGGIYSVSPILKQSLLNSGRAEEPTKEEILRAAAKMVGVDLPEGKPVRRRGRRKAHDADEAGGDEGVSQE